jgi:hypothetical protein
MFLIFALLQLTQASFNPGITASFDLNLIREVKNKYFDLIIKEIENKAAEDVVFDGGYLKNNSFSLHSRSEDV